MGAESAVMEGLPAPVDPTPNVLVSRNDRSGGAAPVGHVNRRVAQIDKSIRQVILELMKTEHDPARALWEVGPRAVRRHMQDITSEEWRLACNRNFWPVYQEELERQEAESGQSPQ
jgi:hypothetical protein